VKRDDAISFGFGGNKVRKLSIVVADAVAAGADALITVGGVQSNHARATAATAAKLGLRCHLIANGAKPQRLTGNALLDGLLGAEVEYVADRTERLPAMRRVAERLRAPAVHQPRFRSVRRLRGCDRIRTRHREMLQQGVRPT
jgi:1-aminocyclopropane-1-carboxylate deaminase/D-cysteine desulfhydrase-like pyridoxal-dependent ACC family enzyme